MTYRVPRGVRAATAVVGAILVFAASWLLRFNDPGGAYAGLTDDHFFYVIRGWQILFGDLPVRDFVDHGAPLYYYVAAAVQHWLGRGTLSELTFSVTSLATGAAITFLLAARASGSATCGLTAAAWQILLAPRFYNYPKILVYTLAVPAIWQFVNRPGWRSLSALSLITAIGFLFRHDHGFFIAVTVAATALVLPISFRDRLRHLGAYAALVLVLLLPYLVFVQSQGGIARYFREGSAWAARDRDRAPVVWPGLDDRSAAGTGPVASIRANSIAWTYYLELALPVLALAALSRTRDAYRAEWPHARIKLASVAVLGILLNAGFLRSPLEARLADPSVPHAILIAWLIAAIPRQLWSGAPLQIGLSVATAAVVVVLGIGSTAGIERRLQSAALLDPFEPFERVDDVERQLRKDWDLRSWVGRENRPDLIEVSLYLEACTQPTDRIFVTPYIPQVAAMARRAFAGGHADLRPGFFTSIEAQELTVARLQRQSVPVVLVESNDSYQNFRKSFPLVTAFLDANYAVAATRLFDSRFDLQLLVRKDLVPTDRYAPLDWPCFNSGTIGNPP